MKEIIIEILTETISAEINDDTMIPFVSISGISSAAEKIEKLFEEKRVTELESALFEQAIAPRGLFNQTWCK